MALLVVLVLTPLQLAAMGRQGYGLVALAAATASYVTRRLWVHSFRCVNDLRIEEK